MSYATPRPYPREFLDVAFTFGRPVAVSKTGYASQSFRTLGIPIRGNEADQYEWLDFLLRRAAEGRYLFVGNWASTDFEKLLEKLPKEAQELARVWAYTSLQRSDRRPKKALELWDRYLRLPRAAPAG